MFDVALINMPFADFNLASIGVTQLQAALNRECFDKAGAEIFYLNHAFAELFGFEGARGVASAVNSSNRGLGTLHTAPWSAARSGVAEILDLSAATGRVLNAFSPDGYVRVARELVPELCEDEVENSLRLNERHILFVEGDHFMSVVLKRQHELTQTDLIRWAT